MESLHNHKQLKVLDLSNNNITDMKELCTLLSNN